MFLTKEEVTQIRELVELHATAQQMRVISLSTVRNVQEEWFKNVRDT